MDVGVNCSRCVGLCVFAVVWMNVGELGVGGWDEIQSMDLEIPQDHRLCC